jgi:hypothetical protein
MRGAERLTPLDEWLLRVYHTSIPLVEGAHLELLVGQGGLALGGARVG